MESVDRKIAKAKAEIAGLAVRLDPYSHWPFTWHDEIMKALRAADALGIRKIYVKEKFGDLRIQGGGNGLLESVVKAKRACSSICTVCGVLCDQQNPPDMPRCVACKTAESSVVIWIEMGAGPDG